MSPSERIKHIKEISKELAKEDWGLLDLTLKQFGLPWTDQWSGSDKERYVVEMLNDALDESLLDLAKHLGLASELETSSSPSFWEESDARIFLSHLATTKVETSKLRNQLRKFGITAFIAHEDIEPTKEWQIEIQSALATMDALIALLSPGFKESNWCDQEVGVAIGRQLQVIAVRQGLDPYGFIGKYQALQGHGKTASLLAKEIFELCIQNPLVGPKVTSKLVEMLMNANSFDESKRLIELINFSQYVTSKHIAKMNDAINENSQVSHSWGVPEQIRKLAEKFEN
ncbi:MAG: TIR domain-containing protein [Spirochaetae bacterium HGW-Spirochaetae-5]|nr:MAG: TIR domain-containing protein [Spirochaetae bacterium HGW-Spirochaetae-5]